MTTNKQLEELDLDQLRELMFEVEQELKVRKAEKKILVWRVVTHGAVCTNFRSDHYEKAIDWMISQIKRFAKEECELEAEEGRPGSWSREGVNPQIPYLTPHWVPESEYLRDWEKDLEK